MLEVDGRDIVNNDGLHATRRRCEELTVSPLPSIIDFQAFRGINTVTLPADIRGKETLGVRRVEWGRCLSPKLPRMCIQSRVSRSLNRKP